MNKEHTEVAVYHEVRIRLLEKINEGIDKKMDAHFYLLLGTMIASLAAFIAVFSIWLK